MASGCYLRVELTQKDHHQISQFLKDLSKDQLLSLAPALGLRYPKFRGKEEHLLGDIISGWLNREDNVAKTPCWEVLINALEEIGQNGIATKIKQSPLIVEPNPSSNTHSPMSPQPHSPQIQSFTETPTYSPEARFPYLNTKHLSQEEKNMFIGRLEAESNMIKRKFAKLVATTSESLEARNVTVGTVIVFLKSCDIPFQQMSEYKSIDGVFFVAIDYWSFFNYGILETLISRWGDDANKESLALYKSDFKKYCKRRLCEVLLDALKCDRRVPTRLRVKTDKNFNISTEDVHALAIELSDLLGTPLLLLDVKDGCIELDFDYLKEENLLPLKDHSEKFK